METRFLVSVGGGINLRPEAFKRISRNAQSARITKIRDVKTRLLTTDQSTNKIRWIRNKSQSGNNSFVHRLPVRRWQTNIDQKVGNLNKIEMSISNGDRIWVSSDSKSGDWKYKSVVNGSTHEITVDKQRNKAAIVTQEYPYEIEVSLDEDQRMITLSRGGAAGQRDLNPPSWMELK